MRVQASIQGMARVEEIRPERTEGRRLAAIAMVIAIGLFVSLMGVSPARADHAEGTLSCENGVSFEGVSFEVDGRKVPAGFEAPGPWSGLFLLEHTTQVFKAFKIDKAQPWEIPAWKRHDLIQCTLVVFGSEWTLHGVLGPRRPS